MLANVTTMKPLTIFECPDCKGDGGSLGHACCGGQGCGPEGVSCWRVCDTCEGKCTVALDDDAAFARMCDGVLPQACRWDLLVLTRADRTLWIAPCRVGDEDSNAGHLFVYADGRDEQPYRLVADSLRELLGVLAHCFTDFVAAEVVPAVSEFATPSRA